MEGSRGAKVETEVTAEVDDLPVYEAFAALTSGKLSDGTDIKLSKNSGMAMSSR